ncbi:beta-ketoacyl synthase N-terminal-like domain-containing protein [Cupriavidus sp. BIS7]|uniref:beta-ketoacyl-[acyl-carrier-protein] synthase family protein n=1 Tax=Cupriavidus sp. BIS7 TaxID=1217718 RepID=UPI0002D8D379|nr:beta-ketoacyl synthase N-terminal-like domain-containing protein [Cupriavidus sp. BIS7]
MNGTQEIHIAGVGAISAAGQSTAAFWEALFDPPNGPDQNAIPFPPAQSKALRHAYRIPASAGQVDDFDALARAAIVEALQDAQLRGIAPHRGITGLALGTAAGDTRTVEQMRADGIAYAFAGSNPYRTISTLPDTLPATIDGPCFVNANACTAGLYAVAHAAQLLLAGQADTMIVLAFDCLSRVSQAGFQRMNALDPDRCRPFDKRRRGTVLGEGAAAAVLIRRPSETSEANTYCRISGIGLSCDAYHPTAPHPDGRDIARAIDLALRSARTSPDEIDFVVPHGTGTETNDRIEAEALANVFGGNAAIPPLLSIKAHIGHTAGASGMFSLLAATYALARRQLPAGGRCEQPDPAIPIRMTAPLAQKHSLRALVQASAFGGNNVALVLQGASA